MVDANEAAPGEPEYRMTFRERVIDVLMRIRIFYLRVVTFGAWRKLGEAVLESDHRVDDLTQEVSRLEWRLDEFMRYWEQYTGESVPGHFEPPRLTAHGEMKDPRSWDEIGKEADRTSAAVKAFKDDPENDVGHQDDLIQEAKKNWEASDAEKRRVNAERDAKRAGNAAPP